METGFYRENKIIAMELKKDPAAFLHLAMETYLEAIKDTTTAFSIYLDKLDTWFSEGEDQLIRGKGEEFVVAITTMRGVVDEQLHHVQHLRPHPLLQTVPQNSENSSETVAKPLATVKERIEGEESDMRVEQQEKIPKPRQRQREVDQLLFNDPLDNNSESSDDDDDVYSVINLPEVDYSEEEEEEEQLPTFIYSHTNADYYLRSNLKPTPFMETQQPKKPKNTATLVKSLLSRSMSFIKIHKNEDKKSPVAIETRVGWNTNVQRGRQRHGRWDDLWEGQQDAVSR